MIRRSALRFLAAAAAAIMLTGCLNTTEPKDESILSPTPISGNQTFVDLSVGDYHSCGLQANGEARCWGTNSQGQSGNGVSSEASTIVPIAVIGGFVFSQISAGGAHSCGILTTGL